MVSSNAWAFAQARIRDVVVFVERFDDKPEPATSPSLEAADRVGSRAVLGPDALAALSRCDWPGNVRELQNAIAWMAVHAPYRGRIGSSSLPSHLASVPLATGSSFEVAVRTSSAGSCDPRSPRPAVSATSRQRCWGSRAGLVEDAAAAADRAFTARTGDLVSGADVHRVGARVVPATGALR